MALATMSIDPNATSYTDDEIVAKINAAADAISRGDAIDYDALNLVVTGPGAGQFKIKKVNRDTDGTLEVVFDDVPVE